MTGHSSITRSLGSIDRVVLDKALAAQKLRIVPMGAVTIEEEVLVQALLKIAGIPGNDCRRVAKKVLETLIKDGKQYGEGVEEPGKTSSKDSGGVTESKS